MSNVNDILSSIYTGRFVAERARADHLARALSEVEDLVREMRPTSEPVTIERGNTADLADAEDMRSLLMEQGQEPSAAGLAEFIRFARMGEDEKDEAKKEADEARKGLLYITGGNPTATIAELVGSVGVELIERLAEVTALRAQIAALTPGPWRTVAEEAPPTGEGVVVIGDGNRACSCILEPWQSLDWVKLWRRLPAGLLDVPAPTVAP